jgi:hypothetical protein
MDGALSDAASEGANIASDGGPEGGGDDATTSGSFDASDAPPPPTAYLRVANWSPDAPQVDFCIAPHGTTAFQGPLFANLEAADDAGTAGLAFTKVSAYVNVPPGQYDARVVAAAAGSCAAGIGHDATTLPTLAANAAATIALFGDEVPSGGDPPLQLVGFLDHLAPLSPFELRFINAAPSLGTADLVTGSLASGMLVQPKPLFLGVSFAQTDNAMEATVSDAAPPPVDRNGYATIAGLNAALLARPSAGASGPIVVTKMSVSVPTGNALTIVLVGGTSSGIPTSLLECVDNAGSDNSLSDCHLLP